MPASSDSKQGAVQKRQQIKDSSKAMFLWVAGMSVIIGFALVISWFLWQQITHKTDVVNAKSETVEILDNNILAAQELRSNIRVLETNTALNNAKADEEDNALQVILDALPSEANSLALGASLQQELVNGISGLSIESLTVTPAGNEVSTEIDTTMSTEEVAANQIFFRIEVVSRSIDAHKELLERFEKSIRVIDIDNLQFERSGETYTMTLDAHAYYQPARQIELVEKELPQ